MQLHKLRGRRSLNSRPELRMAIRRKPKSVG